MLVVPCSRFSLVAMAWPNAPSDRSPTTSYLLSGLPSPWRSCSRSCSGRLRMATMCNSYLMLRKKFETHTRFDFSYPKNNSSLNFFSPEILMLASACCFCFGCVSDATVKHEAWVSFSLLFPYVILSVMKEGCNLAGAHELLLSDWHIANIAVTDREPVRIVLIDWAGHNISPGTTGKQRMKAAKICFLRYLDQTKDLSSFLHVC